MDNSESQSWPDRRRRRRIVAFSLAGMAVLLFLWLVWPTPYRYSKDSDHRRISRFTGEAQVYDKRKDEWRAAKGGRRNGSGTRGGGGSPVGGGSGEDREAEGRDEGSGRTGKKKPKGEQWWYSEGNGSGGSGGGGGSPIGGTRSSEGGRDGSPVGGSRGDEDGRRNSPIGGD